MLQNLDLSHMPRVDVGERAVLFLQEVKPAGTELRMAAQYHAFAGTSPSVIHLPAGADPWRVASEVRSLIELPIPRGDGATDPKKLATLVQLTATAEPAVAVVAAGDLGREPGVGVRLTGEHRDLLVGRWETLTPRDPQIEVTGY